MYDALIVGCGPVGALLANLLGKDGVRVLIIDEMDAPYDKPRAINIDHEVLRTCQACGLAEGVQQGTIAHTGTDFLGVDNQLIRVLKSLEPPFPLGWPPNLMFLQPRMEAVLRQGLERYPCVTLRTKHRLVDFSQSDAAVTARIEKLDDGCVLNVTARYLIGCDGAASRVRKVLEGKQTSLNFDESYVVVDVLVGPDNRLPRRTTHYCRPSGPGTFVVGPDRLRRVEMKIMPDENPQDFLDVEHVRTKLAKFIDISGIEIWRSAPYRFHALVADRWRQGRVMLGGDAAHQMPPHLGQGLCSGVRDIANLSWKLKMVLSGTCADRLLDTYQLERRPHISALVELSKGIAAVTGELDPALAIERDRRMRTEMESGVAITVRQKLIPDLSDGILDPNGSPLTGQLSVQPIVEVRGGGTSRLDDVVGETFAVFGLNADPHSSLTPQTCRTLERIGARLLAIGSPGGAPSHLIEAGDLFRNWMSSHQALFVIVRPDKYVYGTASDSGKLESLARSLIDGLCLSNEGQSRADNDFPVTMREARS